MQLVAKSALQMLPCRRYSLDWSLSTFLSPFIRLFLSPPLKPCGYSTFLIIMQKVRFSPNLYTTAWHVLRNDLHDLRLKVQTGLSFCRWRCWGWVYKNQYQNEHQKAYLCGYGTCLIMMKHVSFSPNLYTTACQFNVMFLVTFNQIHRKWYRLIILFKYTDYPFSLPLPLFSTKRRIERKKRKRRKPGVR